MTIGELISIIFGWQVLGGIICMAIAARIDTDGWELANPYWCYKLTRLNFFGTFVVCLLYNALCPIASICYWIYWLCTVGRKK